jgi:hypothetical protein
MFGLPSSTVAQLWVAVENFGLCIYERGHTYMDEKENEERERREMFLRIQEEENKEEEYRNTFLPIAPIAETICGLLYELPHFQVWCRKLLGVLELQAYVDEKGERQMNGNLVFYEKNYRRNKMASELQQFSECLWSLLNPYWFNASKVNGSKVFDGIEEGKLFLQNKGDTAKLQILCRLESALYKFIAYYCARQSNELNATKQDFAATKRKLERANGEVKRMEVELAAAKEELAAAKLDIAKIHETLWTAHTSDSLDHVDSPRGGMRSTSQLLADLKMLRT